MTSSIFDSNCIFDIPVTTGTVSSTGIGYNTSEMKNLDTYMSLGWDGGSWIIHEKNDGYPRFSSGSTFVDYTTENESATIYPNPAYTFIRITGK